MSKLSSKLYNLQRKIYKMARALTDMEDLSRGRIDKITKRRIKYSIKKEIGKLIARFFNNIGL